jgi:hypothetical protein
LDALEDRTNPASLNFVPFTTVAVNPEPLPPTALIQFNPLPDLTGLSAGATTFTRPIVVQGVFHQSLIPSTATGGATAAMATAAGPVAGPHLDLTYSLRGTVTWSSPPPTAGATGPAAFTATFNLTGVVNGAIYVPGQSAPMVWSINSTLTEQGSVTGPFFTPSASPVAGEIATFSLQVGLTQTEAHAATAVNSAFPWRIQSTNQSAGKFQLNTILPPSATAIPVLAPTPFSLQNQIGETLTQLTPMASGALLQPIRISATDDASGTVTTNFYPLVLAMLPPVAPGSTQYHEQLSETITYPPGPTQPGATQTVTEGFDTTGLFQAFGIVPVTSLPVSTLPSVETA